MIKSLLKKILPSSVVANANTVLALPGFIKNYYYDAQRFSKYSTTISRQKTIDQLDARIIAHYHVLEKGMTFEDVRLGYGKDILFSLFGLLQEVKDQGLTKKIASYDVALGVLKSYINFHTEKGFTVTDVEKNLQQFLKGDSNAGGTKKISQKEILKDTTKNFELLANSRYSVRNFTSEKVAISTIKEALEIAQKTPSVCNRQSTKVYVLKDKKKIQAALSCQRGNRGFAHFY